MAPFSTRRKGIDNDDDTWFSLACLPVACEKDSFSSNLSLCLSEGRTQQQRDVCLLKKIISL